MYLGTGKFEKVSMEINKDIAVVLMLTHQSLQSENLKEMLAQNTGLNIQIIDTKQTHYQEVVPEQCYLLVDCSVNVPKAIIEQYVESGNVKGTIMLNLNKELTPEDMLMWPSLKGTFSPHDSMSQLCSGLKAIVGGDNWLPRKTLGQLLNYYEERGVIGNDAPELEVELTRREVQVLQFLKNGGSNMEIADSLFISEHTIKSHLYNIFRKIDVKNRVQATAWARKYLVS